MRGVSGNRLAWAILGGVVLIGSTVGLTLAATAPSAPAASSPVVATSAGTRGGMASGTASTTGLAGPATGAVAQGSGATPVWCCSAGSPLGVTATGQAAALGAGA